MLIRPAIRPPEILITKHRVKDKRTRTETLVTTTFRRRLLDHGV
uniref:Uncharacterized protein n=1 Tax=uncultured bacterium contig00054 TaxID=1181538 RepID=A0A806K287_9BACT|nr:hypothetical protein [uncultured bacterium contig00054]